MSWCWVIYSLFVTISYTFSIVSNYNIEMMGKGYNRLIFIHVPFAWLISLLYLIISFLALYFLVRRNPKVMDWVKELTLVGVVGSVITLMTGSIWGKYTWGTYWEWESRIIMVLVILLLYIAIWNMLKYYTSQRIAYMILLGLVNLPLIRYSVEAWSGLHQGSSISTLGSVMEEGIGIIIVGVFLGILLVTYRIFYALKEGKKLLRLLDVLQVIYYIIVV